MASVRSNSRGGSGSSVSAGWSSFFGSNSASLHSGWDYGAGAGGAVAEGDDDVAGEGDEDVEGGLTDDWESRYTSRDCLLFVIDARPAMHVRPKQSSKKEVVQKADGESTQEVEKAMEDQLGDSPFVSAIKCVIATLKNKVVSSENDFVGVMLFGTDKQQNATNRQHIYVLQDLQNPDVHFIRTLIESYEKGKVNFETELGFAKTEVLMSDVFWVCSHLFSTAPKMSTKRIFLITSEDNPHAGNHNLRQAAFTRAKDLSDLGIRIELFPIISENKKFDFDNFYKELLNIDEDNEADLQTEASMKFEELFQQIRRKETKKRAMLRIPLRLTDNMEIGVGLYALILEQKKGSHCTIAAKTNKLVERKSKLVSESGTAVLAVDVKSAFEYGGKKVLFTKEETTSMKSVCEPGLLLMGFKPRQSLKKHHNIRSPYFCYPDETVVAGSTTVFSALLSEMNRLEKIAICRLVARKNTAPRLVALVPQVEELDENRVQEKPPGFHIVFLPFADDLRHLTYDASVVDNSSESFLKNVDKAKEFIKKLTFPQFSSDNYENPVLQRHYAMLQALALGQPVEEVEDLTEPKVSVMSKRSGAAIEEFKQLVFPDGAPEPAAKNRSSTKRTAASAETIKITSPKGKKVKAEGDIDIEQLVKDGKLASLTIPILKEFLSTKGVKAKTRKQDIIEQIEKLYGVSD